jgi:hypothetical protein
MPTIRPYAVLRSCLWGCLILLSLSACSSTYHFRYRYALIAPSGSADGVDNEQVRIQLSPAPDTGIMQLAILNKSTQAIAIVWDQTHYVDPLGRRRPATETGMQWFFRPREWFADDTRIDPGQTFNARVQAGEHQLYNPFTLSRSASGDVAASTAAAPLLPTGATARTVGQAYQGREFRFVLALRQGTDVTLYPFTFRITSVEVQ